MDFFKVKHFEMYGETSSTHNDLRTGFDIDDKRVLLGTIPHVVRYDGPEFYKSEYRKRLDQGDWIAKAIQKAQGEIVKKMYYFVNFLTPPQRYADPNYLPAIYENTYVIDRYLKGAVVVDSFQEGTQYGIIFQKGEGEDKYFYKLTLYSDISEELRGHMRLRTTSDPSIGDLE